MPRRRLPHGKARRPSAEWCAFAAEGRDICTRAGSSQSTCHIECWGSRWHREHPNGYERPDPREILRTL
jgi:hypothetical protein